MTKIEGETLTSVLPVLGRAYGNWKRLEQEKNDYRDRFFALADVELEQAGLAHKTVTITLADETAARLRAERHNPGWVVISVQPSDPSGTCDVLLGEDPTLKAFAFVHKGIRYARAVSRGAVMVDDEWLAEAEPELYQQVTFMLPWGERIMLPVEQLGQAMLARMEKYIYTARPRVSLSAPRPAKDGET